METEAAIQVELCFRPRAEHEPQLGTDDAVPIIAGVFRLIAFDIETEKICTDACCEAEFFKNQHIVLGEECRRGFMNIILTHRLETVAGLGLVEADTIHPVVPGVEAQGGGNIVATDFIVPGP